DGSSFNLFIFDVALSDIATAEDKSSWDLQLIQNPGSMLNMVSLLKNSFPTFTISSSNLDTSGNDNVQT
ncbi:hypothetical protein L9G74_22055, partial [Shewanella sp. C32]|nr:hypothetical protein [Shewanella electrica]